jgi:hypothetical protein
MTTIRSATDQRALVTVFDDLESAKTVVASLHRAGFAKESIELVIREVRDEAPEVDTPRVHETTGSSLIDGAKKWGAVGLGAGAAAGLIASVFTPFPGLIIGEMIFAGITGAILGGMAGVDRAVHVDSVNLPTLEEYEQLVKNGNSLVVVLGNHDEVLKAENAIKQMYSVRSHIHSVQGHEYHEHPVRERPDS